MALKEPRLVSMVGSGEQISVSAERNFRNLRDFAHDLLLRCPWLDGLALANVALGAGSTDVPHLLGRAYRGWWVTGGGLAGDHPVEGVSPDGTKWLRLAVVGAQTVDLWVY